MINAILALQLSVIIPVVAGIIYFARLNLFLRIIFFSLVASMVSDFLGTVAAFYWGGNSIIFFIYFIVHCLLIMFAWHSIEQYSRLTKMVILGVGLSVTIATLLAFTLNLDSIIASSLNIALLIFYSLQYYTLKILKSDSQQSIVEEKFIVASAFLIYSIPVLIIYGTYLIFTGPEFDVIWILKSVFYLILNILMAIAFYYYQKQNLKVG